MDIRDENPYQSPQVTDDLPVGVPTVSVAGNILLAPSGTVLPPICVVGGQSVGDDCMIEQTFYCYPWNSTRKKCTLTYALHHDLQKMYRRRRRRRLFCAASVPGLWVIAAITAQFELVGVSILMLVLYRVSMLFVRESPLVVIDYRKGTFYIKGCSAAFLNKLEAALTERRDSDPATLRSRVN
jgi:hypothetical protein